MNEILSYYSLFEWYLIFQVISLHAAGTWLHIKLGYTVYTMTGKPINRHAKFAIWALALTWFCWTYLICKKSKTIKFDKLQA